MPQLPNRRSIRLKGYDYSQEGMYFITICCYHRICLFGNVRDGEMRLNVAGKAAEKCWKKIPEHFKRVELHEFVIMPNHIHGIIEIKSVGANHHSPADETGQNVDDDLTKPSKTNQKQLSNQMPKYRAKNLSPLQRPRGTSKTVGSIVRGVKIGITKWMRNNTDVYPVWQRNYYDHIIRNTTAYLRIAEYIKNNPVNWEGDEFYQSA